jgi:uncharacterized protein
VDLTGEQQRVLGCLVEKSMITPDQYPLTMNSLVTACNQSTSRDPVVEYSADEAKAAVDHLRMRHRYVRVELPRPGSRVEKFKHDLVNQLGLSDPELAVMAILLLRGPQTLNELKTRTERLYAFESLVELEATIDHLTDPTKDVENAVGTISDGQLAGTVLSNAPERPANYRRTWPGPLAVRLERFPGQKEPRVAQLMGGAIDLEAAIAAIAASQVGPSAVAHAGARTERIDALEAEVQRLHSELDALRQEFTTFKSQF